MDIKVYDIDGKEYMLMSELDDNDIHYLLLVNKADNDELLFRKVDGEHLVPLDDEKEVSRILQLFDEIN